MKRWREEIKIAKKQKQLYGYFVENSTKPLGKYRKRHALDCGKSKCFICHQDKLLDKFTKKEYISRKNFEEQKNEYYSGN